MKGLAIYSIVALGICFLGFVSLIADGTATGYTLFAGALLTPIMVFACIFVGGKYHSEGH